ncbi:MAG: hypothetical protein HKN21_06210, partial [Candidatus Eisenbacteria bacterium]|nr:hypothetical protein [Candidatus Eisenbacteria bacterium]
MIDKPQATHLLLLCVLSCVILFAIPNPLVASVFCEKCGQEIRGDYIVVEDRSYHSHHVQCFLCEKGFNGQFLIYNGQPAHRACLNEESSPLPRCSLCKQAIWSAYEV